MNTPTPRTDAIAKGIGRIYAETRGRETSTIEFAERVQSFIDDSVGQLEQELNEAKLKAEDRNEWQEVAMKVSAERDTLKRERDEARLQAQQGNETVYRWRKLVTDAEAERDQLRKIADELAKRHASIAEYHRGTPMSEATQKLLYNSYNSLPHVKERKSK